MTTNKIGIAACAGQIEQVKSLLNKGEDPSAGGNYAILRASGCGQIEVVELLLSDTRVNPSDQNNDVIGDAVENGHTNIVELLLADDRLILSNNDCEMLICRAAIRGQIHTIKFLFTHTKIDLSINNIKLATQIACEYGQESVVEFLLADERVVNFSRYEYEILIVMAAVYNNINTVKFLLNYLSSDKINLSACNGKLAIKSAVERGHVDVSKTINLCGDDIKQAIQIAVEQGYVDIR